MAKNAEGDLGVKLAHWLVSRLVDGENSEGSCTWLNDGNQCLDEGSEWDATNKNAE